MLFGAAMLLWSLHEGAPALSPSCTCSARSALLMRIPLVEDRICGAPNPLEPPFMLKKVYHLLHDQRKARQQFHQVHDGADVTAPRSHIGVVIGNATARTTQQKCMQLLCWHSQCQLTGCRSSWRKHKVCSSVEAKSVVWKTIELCGALRFCLISALGPD